MLREIVLLYLEVTRILCVEMIKSCKFSQRTEPSPCVNVLRCREHDSLFPEENFKVTLRIKSDDK